MVSSRAILEIQETTVPKFYSHGAHKWYDFDLVISDLLDLIIRFLGLFMLIAIYHERWFDMIYNDASEIPYKFCY